jgi:hypothetical protein
MSDARGPIENGPRQSPHTHPTTLLVRPEPDAIAHLPRPLATEVLSPSRRVGQWARPGGHFGTLAWYPACSVGWVHPPPDHGRQLGPGWRPLPAPMRGGDGPVTPSRSLSSGPGLSDSQAAHCHWHSRRSPRLGHPPAVTVARRLLRFSKPGLRPSPSRAPREPETPPAG